MATHLRVQRRAFGVCLSLLLAQGAVAYDHPLDSYAIREAYFLGRSSNQEKLAKFQGQYVKHLPLPKTGPHISEIEVRTPFAQVVARSIENSVGYSAQQAEKDYNEHPDTVQVRIQIRFTPTYTLDVPVPAGKPGFRMRTEDFFRDFAFHTSQDRELRPKDAYGIPLYGYGRLTSYLVGADVWFEFGTDQIQSAPLRVEVSTPDGQKVSAEFDLKDLR